jgi:hypothetical protein
MFIINVPAASVAANPGEIPGRVFYAGLLAV